MPAAAGRRVAEGRVSKPARDIAEGTMEVHFEFIIAGEIKCPSVNIGLETELWIKYGNFEVL
jgi:hypothetical protein